MALSRTNATTKCCARLLASVEGASLPSFPRQRFAAGLRAQPSTARAFSTSIPLSKKRKIAAASNSPRHRDDADEADTHDAPPSARGKAASTSAAPKSAGQLDPDDPLDMTPVTAGYGPLDTHFRSQLSNMVHGGRFNPTALGALPVPIKDHGSDAATFPLRELAQIVPRSGRAISLLVNEKDYIKPIMSAVQSSKEFNQQPQRSDDNELELLLTVERERRDDVFKRIKEATQAWKEGVRRVRTKHEKVLKDWKKNGTVVPDVVRKAEKELQKVQDKKMKDIDLEEASTIKQL